MQEESVLQPIPSLGGNLDTDQGTGPSALDSPNPGASLPSFIPTLPSLPVNFPSMALAPNQGLSGSDFTKSIQAKFDEQPANPVGQTFISGGVPAEIGLREKPTRPGFFETLGHSYVEYNRTVQSGELIYHGIFDDAHDKDIPPEGWTAMTPEAVEGYPQNYWSYLTSAKTPKDLEARQQAIVQQMEDDERFADGSMLAKFIGGAAGIGTDPVTYVLPLLAGTRYAGITQDILMNLGRVAPTMALDSLSRQSLIEANRAGGNVQDALINSFADFTFNAALLGAGFGAANILHKGKIWESRKAVNIIAEGMDINPVIDAEGKITGVRATPGKGQNIGAAEVDVANKYLSERMSKTGLFATPFIGEHLTKVFSFGSPVLKAANSPYNTVKSFFNSIATHGVITEGEAAGVAKADSAWDYSSFYHDEGIALAEKIKNHFFNLNGISGISPTFNALKNFKQTVSNEQTLTEEAFGKDIRRVVYDKKYKSEHAQVNESASLLMEYFDRINEEYHAAKGTTAKFKDPRTSWKYLPQNYNLPLMINRPEEWIALTANAYKAQDAEIARLMTPVNQAKANLDSLRKLKEQHVLAGNETEFKSINAQIKAAERQHAKAQMALDKEIATNDDVNILIEDRNGLTHEESVELEKLLERQNIVQAKVDQRGREVTAVKSQISKVKQRMRKVVGKEAADAQRLKLKELEAQLAEKQKLHAEVEDELIDEQNALQQQAIEGKINERLYEEYQGEFKFRNPKERLKLRAPFASDAERESLARQYHESILNQSPMDLMNNILGVQEGGFKENPNYTKQRVNLVNSQIYNDSGFLDPDITKSLVSYARTMGKQIGFKKAFPQWAKGKTTDGLLGEFKREHDARKAEILKEPVSPERDKKLTNLEKEFQKARKFMQDTYQVYFGTYNASQNPTLMRFSHTMRNLVASAKLGAVPIYQVSELASIMLKNGLMPFLAQGLRPLIKSVFTLRNDPEWQDIKKTVGSTYVALNHASNGYAQRMINSDSMSSVTVGGGFGNVGIWAENLAHVSGNLYGINLLANANETLAANTFQSEVMRILFAFKNGTMTKTEGQKLAHVGIQPEEWADRFIKSYQESGGWEVAGGFQSKHFDWADAQASNRMTMSIRRAVQETIINQDPFSKPYLFANNPILSMIFMFHGWAYGALTKYTVPLMQRPDAEHMLSVGLIVGMNMMSEPLLRLANGKDMFEDDENWYQAAFKAVDYSGMLGPALTFAQDINKMSGNVIIPKLQTERVKSQPGLFAAAGPVAGYLNDAMGVGGHLIKGNITQGDANKFARLLPFMSLLPIRKPINQIIANSPLPEDRRNAEPWAAWSAINGKQE